jgi:hypothetical protein
MPKDATSMRLDGLSPGLARPLVTCLLLLTFGAQLAEAQVAPVTRDSVTLAPGPQFHTTFWLKWLGTTLFGSRYRDLWNTEIALPVLDLDRTGDGLHLVADEAETDTAVRHFEGHDGSRWVFLPVARIDPRTSRIKVLPSNVNDGLIADLASGRHPAGPLVAAALAAAAGVPNQEGWLVALPAGDDVAGADSAATLLPGYLLRDDPLPTADSTGPVTPGAVATLLTVRHRVLVSPTERVDPRAVLRASLFDLFVGDLNPRFAQWRMEAIPSDGGIAWRPMGRFREGALADYDGIVTSVARPMHPDLSTFGGGYPSDLIGTPLQTSAYRWLLGSLDRATWDSAAAELSRLLTDSVIDGAVARLPPAYRERMGETLARKLRERRDRLPEAAGRMYRQLREYGEVRGTLAADAVEVEWLPGDSLALRLDGGEQLFDAGETRRVTLFPNGGADTVRFVGRPGHQPELRIAPPPEAAIVVEGDAAGGPAAVHGERTGVRVVPPGAIALRSKPVRDVLARMDSTTIERTKRSIQYRPTGWFELRSGPGLLVGAGVVRTDWSGKAVPYRNWTRLRAAYGTGSSRFIVELKNELRWATSPLQVRLSAVASGVGAIYYHGLGNETSSDRSRSYYRAAQTQYGVAPTVVLPLSNRVRVGTGLEFKWVKTPLDTALFIGVDRPYGTPSFGETGLTGQLVFDSRDVTGAPRSGAHLSLDGAWYPVIGNGAGTFGTVTGSASGFLTPPWWQAMTIAARVAGTATFGDVPYFEAAFIGGSHSVRGLPRGRYSGDQSLLGNLDLRWRLSRVQFVMPWDFGLLGLADVGRVFVSGEHSDVWHPSYGGGIWLALLDRSLAASLAVATGAGEGVFINLGGGFSF